MIALALLSVFSLSAFSQNIDTRRKIEVNGSAEAEVTPDIIYIGMSLKEYFRDSNNKKKVEIEDLERQLQSAVLKAGIPQENFTINNISSYNNWWEKKTPDFLARKQYQIKVTDLTKFNEIMSAINPKGIEYSNIESYDYSKKESLKKELKIKALQEAKAKAEYLITSIGGTLGGALDIQEINNEYYPQPMYKTNMVLLRGDAVSSAESAMPDIDFKKIKLNYQMRAVFEIK
jgi:uncharacterized protein YggE